MTTSENGAEYLHNVAESGWLTTDVYHVRPWVNVKHIIKFDNEAGRNVVPETISSSDPITDLFGDHGVIPTVDKQKESDAVEAKKSDIERRRKVALTEESDEDWQSGRGWFIADVIEGIPDENLYTGYYNEEEFSASTKEQLFKILNAKFDAELEDLQTSAQEPIQQTEATEEQEQTDTSIGMEDDFSEDVQYQKVTVNNTNATEDVESSGIYTPYQKQTNSNEGIIATEKTIRDLAARVADRIGMKVIFESSRIKQYKGKIKNNVVYINLAYATLDTPIHEILGHPIVREILKGNKTLYNNLLKELETGRGKEVLERVKRDYKYKESLQDDKQLGNLFEEDGKYYFFDEYAGRCRKAH